MKDPDEARVQATGAPRGRLADGTAAVVNYTQKGATVADLGLRGASHVAWGDSR